MHGRLRHKCWSAVTRPEDVSNIFAYHVQAIPACKVCTAGLSASLVAANPAPGPARATSGLKPHVQALLGIRARCAGVGRACATSSSFTGGPF
ncbi:hypothetical protein HaLaN_27068, partial [Haematococcus lacustris]